MRLQKDKLRAVLTNVPNKKTALNCFKTVFPYI